jgi:hypothetical protein
MNGNFGQRNTTKSLQFGFELEAYFFLATNVSAVLPRFQGVEPLIAHTLSFVQGDLIIKAFQKTKKEGLIFDLMRFSQQLPLPKKCMNFVQQPRTGIRKHYLS